MTWTAAVGLTGLIVASSAAYVLIPAILPALVASLRPRKAICPATRSEVLVRTRTLSEIWASFGRGEPEILACSRWPAANKCDRACARSLRI